MTSTKATTAKTNSPADPIKPTTPSTTKPVAVRKAKAPVKKAPPKSATEVKTELPVLNQIAPFTIKKKKNDKAKVIRDSFSFPEHDYYKITELKKICLEAGVHVKKGEVLRAGLNLLTELKLSQLLEAVAKVEKVQTGRPKSEK